MQVHARVTHEPAVDQRGLVRAGVVEHEVQVELGRGSRVDGGQEVAELDAAVAAMDFADDAAGLDVKRSKEGQLAEAQFEQGRVPVLA